MSSQSKRAKWVIQLVIAAPILLFGCCLGSCLIPWPQLNPAAVPWKKMTVEYCMGEPPAVTMKSWETEDQKLLNDLRGVLIIKEQRGSILVPTMLTNRIAVTRTDGKNIIMYIPSEYEVWFHNAANRKQSYSSYIDSVFATKLRYMIEDATGERIHFYYGREVTITR